jgi:Cdc6-like AAA superfamily ATPase
MPYEKSRYKLENFIARALDDGEIRDGVNQADLDESDLRERFLRPGLEEKAPKIWEAAASEIEAFNQVENAYNARLTELRREEARLRRSFLRMPKWGMMAVLVTLSPVFLLPSLMLFLFLLGLIGLSQGGLITIALILVPVSLVYVALSRYLYRRYSVSKERYDERLVEIQRELESNALAERLKTAEQEVERAVIERGILQDLRSIINTYRPSYDTSLTISSAPGLAEVFDPSYEIPTEAKEKLYRLLANMPGGSIGISGPRGVGKTTLLESFCSKASTTELKDRPVLSVMVSAPVKYDPREFILHIFSSVCQRVLEIKGKVSQAPWRYMVGTQRPPITFFSTIMDLRETLAVVLLGLFLMSTLFMSSLLSNLSDFFLDFFFGLGLFLVVLGIVGLLIHVYAMRQRRRHTQLEKTQEKELYGDDPLVTEAYQWLREIQFQQSYSSGWAGALKASVASIGVESSVNTAIQLAQNQKSLPEIVDRYLEFLKLASSEYEIIIGIDELDKIGSDEDAQRFLNEIKALFGVESCFYLISVSESAMSSFERRGLPFRDVFDSSFDAIVHADYINLDKAQRLLRRRVIGVPVPFLDFCHCMVGGLPRDLIRTFRALYEEYRQQLQSGSGQSDLSTLCGSLLKGDLQAKLRATSVAAKDIMLEPEVNQLFEMLRRLEAMLDSTDSLLTVYPDLLQGYKDLLTRAHEKSARQAESEEVAAKRGEIVSLSTELGVYLYYSATLLEFFGEKVPTNIDNLKEAENSGALDQLARIRQYFAVSPRVAESGIREFRNNHSMDIPEGVAANPAYTVQ